MMTPARSSGTGRKEYIMTCLIVRRTPVYLVVQSIFLVTRTGIAGLVQKYVAVQLRYSFDVSKEFWEKSAIRKALYPAP
jgi:hypothetical protein